jgi:hypothetical protein
MFTTILSGCSDLFLIAFFHRFSSALLVSPRIADLKLFATFDDMPVL